MGLKNQVVTTVDKESGAVVQSGPPTTSGGDGTTGADPPHSPSRFDKFEHKVKPDPNSSTPPWLANLKKKKAEMATASTSLVSPRTSGVIEVQEDDAAALFAKAGSGGIVAPAGGNKDAEDDDAAALFFGGGGSTAAKSTATPPEALSPEQEEVSARFRKMIQMGT